MTTLVPTILQHGRWKPDPAEWVDTAAVNILRNSPYQELWAQMNVAGAGLLSLSTAVLALTSDAFIIGQDYILDLLVFDQAYALTPFTTASPPLARRTMSAFFSFTGAATSYTIDLPLQDGNGTPTDFRALLQRANTTFALGIAVNSASPAQELRATTLVSLTLTGISNVTGDADLRAPAGTDQQVECPRCGLYVLQSSLTEDGVQRGLLVCAGCYDPPTPPPNWRLPFR